jgi:hypothetical protein
MTAKADIPDERGHRVDAQTRPAWARLGRLLMERRARLNPRWTVRKAFAADVGLNAGLIRDIETAQRDTYTPATLAAVETAYRYAPGSIANVLEGGDPIELAEPPTTATAPAPPAPAVSDSSLLEQYEAQIWDMHGLSMRVRQQMVIALKAAVEAEQHADTRPNARVAEFKNRA